MLKFNKKLKKGLELGYEVNWGVFFSFLFHCNPISAHWVAFESDDWSSIWEFCLDVSILILMMYYDLMTHLWSNVSCTIPARHHCPNRIILCSNSGIYEWLLWPLISNHSLPFIYLFLFSRPCSYEGLGLGAIHLLITKDNCTKTNKKKKRRKNEEIITWSILQNNLLPLFFALIFKDSICRE